LIIQVPEGHRRRGHQADLDCPGCTGDRRARWGRWPGCCRGRIL